jgi:hypothetical protein
MDKETIKSIKNIQSDINLVESINYLFDNYSKIYFKIINSVCTDSDIKEELFSECKYNIYQAAREFKFSKNVKFSSYLGNCAKWCTYNKISEITRFKKIQNRFENEFLSTNSIRRFQ